MARNISRIYLDYAASTPVDPAVLHAMEPYFMKRFGNPGSLHSFGQEAIAALDRSRETIARSIGAEFRDIIFTSSATEANNLALRGVVRAGENKKYRVIISAIEHESVLETARGLERAGVEVIYVPVDKQGVVNLKKLKESLNDKTVLVSIMYANNEIGTVQPIREIGKIIREFKETSLVGAKPFFHTDAAQAFQFLDCNAATLGVDLMTLSSHKIYGPKGTGALYIGKNIRSAQSVSLDAVISGGGQEYNLRSGTENVPAIVGFAKAIELADAARKKESLRIAALRDQLWRGIQKIYPKAEINGAAFDQKAQTLPNILNIYFPGYHAQELLTKFDLAGLAVSSGSACRSRAMESSYVIEALGASKNSPERAKSSIRFSPGRPTAKGDIVAAVKLFSKSIRSL
jgi:cysteine desulfurase